MSDTLPINWEQWRLADVGEWFGGGTPSSSNARFWDGNIPWVSPKDMKVASITSTQDQITVGAVQNSAVKLISAGSVLFVTRSGILAHSFPVATTKVQVTVNQDLKAITPVEVVDHNYLAWLLRALERQILTTCSKHGTTVHSIEIPTLKDLRVPIPPPAEQRRIVAKIEVLFSELDKGVESLTTARQQLKAYRQSVLKYAFEGKLTADWRAKNPDRETGAALRQRVLKTRRDEWEKAEKARLKEQGRLPSNDHWRSRYPEPEGFDDEELPALPDEWCWAGLDEMVSGKPRSMQSGPFGSNLLHSEFQASGS
jgi:type I restriction enzyme S subunit